MQEDRRIFVAARNDSLESQLQRLTKSLSELSIERGSLIANINKKSQDILNKEETIQSQKVILDTLLQNPKNEKLWSIPGTELPGGGVRHIITRDDLKSGEDSREQDEFNFAFGQMLRLQRDGERTIRVEKVVVYESPLTAAIYESKKDAMGGQDCRELWVFHGTAQKNIDPIMASGFQVGSESGPVRIENGAVYGRGVYTATGPQTPMCYSNSKGNAVILSKALEGRKGTQGIGDCWVPRDDCYFQNERAAATKV